MDSHTRLCAELTDKENGFERGTGVEIDICDQENEGIGICQSIIVRLLGREVVADGLTFQTEFSLSGPAAQGEHGGRSIAKAVARLNLFVSVRAAL